MAHPRGQARWRSRSGAGRSPRAPCAGAGEPLDRCLVPAGLDEIRADVVVRVAEGRVHGDGPPALRDRLLVLALVGERPADEGVRFGARVESEGTPVALDGLVETARHLGVIAALEV